MAGCASATLDLGGPLVARRPAGAAVPPVVARALADFSGTVLARLAAGQRAGRGGNVVCSPLSIWVALAMTRNGARGVTATEMDQALRFPALDVLNDGLNTLLQVLRTRAGRVVADDRASEIQLDLANQVFGERSVTWLEPFLTVLGGCYGTGVARADFVGDPEGERRTINAWVADVTHDSIDELVPAGLITPLTRLVLINALHLTATWQTPFGDPVPGVFHADAGDRPAEMVTASFPGRIALGDGWQAVEIPYQGGKLAMTVVLPEPGAEARVAEGLGAGLVHEVLASLEPGQEVELTLPPFSFRTQAPLRGLLESLGMRAAFDDADFSGLAAEAGLAISEVVHEGWIAVDQHGTEAAAATAVIMEEVSAGPSRVHRVELDHPFWFVIHDLPTGVAILAGRVGDPTSPA